MQPGYICVAGIEPEKGKHVRPVLNRRLSASLLKSHGGPFEVGALVDLGGVKYVGSPPEVEDHLFDSSRARNIKRLAPQDFWKILSTGVAPDLASAFGSDLESQGNGCAVLGGKGCASLGSISVDQATLDIDPWNKIRCGFRSGSFEVELSVTDLRFVEADFATPREKNVELASRKFAKRTAAILCVGLARAWQKPGDMHERHWLQVNNIHFSDDPLGLKLS